MRALFATQPGSGHVHPLLPFARALTEAGHEVAFACADRFRPDVEAAGFTAFPAGIDWRNDELSRFLPGAPPPGSARSAWINRWWRSEAARATTADLLALADRWRPDLFVRDPLEFGAPLTAELLGLPHAAAGALWFRPQAPLTAPLDALRREMGLAPDPAGAKLYRYLALAPMPPSWVAPDEEAPPPRTSFARRPSTTRGETSCSPGSLADRPAGRWSTRRSAPPR